jgi:Uncharacterised nucleotidyltransferase
VDLSPERELLLACTRSKLTPENRQRIAKLAGGDLDWERLVSLSYAHGIAPLIYHSLQQSAVNHRMPPAAARALRDSYYLNAARNSLLYNELTRILNALSDRSIEVIVLKGAALAETVYPHRAFRPMSDIDLLVKSERLADVEAKLLEIGYAPDAGTKTHHQYHWVFTKNSTPSIEIHWHVQRPTDPFMVDIEGCWRRAESVSIAGVEAFIFSPADLLLHLCQHLGQHKFTGGIRPLCDLSEATKYYGDRIDWIKVASISSAWRMNGCAYLVFWLARELLDAPIPDDFVRELRPVNFNPEVIDWAKEAVLGYEPCPAVFPDLVKLFWSGPSPKERWAILQRILSRKTVAAYANETSAAEKTYLYYPSRIKHLVTRYGPTVGRLWAGDQKIRAAAKTEERQQRLTKWLSEASTSSYQR